MFLCDWLRLITFRLKLTHKDSDGLSDQREAAITQLLRVYEGVISTVLSAQRGVIFNDRHGIDDSGHRGFEWRCRFEQRQD